MPTGMNSGGYVIRWRNVYGNQPARDTDIVVRGLHQAEGCAKELNAKAEGVIEYTFERTKKHINTEWRPG